MHSLDHYSLQMDVAQPSIALNPRPHMGKLSMLNMADSIAHSLLCDIIAALSPLDAFAWQSLPSALTLHQISIHHHFVSTLLRVLSGEGEAVH